MLLMIACIIGARTKREARVFKVAIMAIKTPAPAAALYMLQKPSLSVLT